MLRFCLGAAFGTGAGATTTYLTDSPVIAVVVGLAAALAVWCWRVLIDCVDDIVDVLT